MNNQNEFFEEIATIFDNWVETVVKSVSEEKYDLIWTNNPEAFKRIRPILPEAFKRIRPILADGNLSNAFETVIREGMQGLLHSILVTFDGGSKLAEKTSLTITDSDGNEFDKHLLELFVTHLINTGRL